MKCSTAATMRDEPTKRRRTNYSDPENAKIIAKAVQMLLDQGRHANVRLVGEVTGIPYNTLRDHYRKATTADNSEPSDIEIVDAYEAAGEGGGNEGGDLTSSYVESGKRRGRKPRLPKIAEYFLKTFAIEMENIGSPLDRTQLKQVALYVSSQLQVPEFKATDMWVQAFQTRNKLNITKTNPKNKTGWRLNPAFLSPNFSHPAPPQGTVQEQISTLLAIFHYLLQHLSGAILVSTEPVWNALLHRAQDVQTPSSATEAPKYSALPNCSQMDLDISSYVMDAADSPCVPPPAIATTEIPKLPIALAQQTQAPPPLALPEYPASAHHHDETHTSHVAYPFFRTRLPEFPPASTYIEALTARSDVPLFVCASNTSTPTPTSVAISSTVATYSASSAGDEKILEGAENRK